MFLFLTIFKIKLLSINHEDIKSDVNAEDSKRTELPRKYDFRNYRVFHILLDRQWVNLRFSRD